MKCFERLILHHLKAMTDALQDPQQFAYRANRSVDDAINLALHHILQHLDSAHTYTRILFVDFSSAFNTIIPDLLLDTLLLLNVPSPLCHWIHDFLTNRKQCVKVGDLTSDPLLLSTGAPQGCVLSSLLYSLYTNDCTSNSESVKLLKFADDTTLIGLISDGDESRYREEVSQLVSWCGANNLELNTQKTVEMVIDFRRKPTPLPPLEIHGTMVSRAESYKFLGTTIQQDLKWDKNITTITKKAQQRMYFL
ncbi:hypothetical protein AAFF_G00185700 [Aldrovandia affinis]|uniref:Reverse transcriptase domain-containing protein n=1 Tax=Aldrovandia affinis TaxID=143900 RepID=A0AAD7RJP8_9TELE|nr:hypothetical protein AAFF_G00185700 [Aldrovandia affinis]